MFIELGKHRPMTRRLWNVYLSGEIHTSWRDEIANYVQEHDVSVRLMAPELDHPTSDRCGDTILGKEPDAFWSDHKAAKINAIRTRGVMANCDVVVVRFGEKYRQWNAAFDAGCAFAAGKSVITLHDKSLDHALKEVDAAALAVARSSEEVGKVLEYVTRGPF